MYAYEITYWFHDLLKTTVAQSKNEHDNLIDHLKGEGAFIAGVQRFCTIPYEERFYE